MPNRDRQNARNLAATYAALAVGIALSLILLASLSGLAFADQPPSASPEAESAAIAYDAMISNTDEGRAQFGQIFIGTVIRVAGRNELATSDPEDTIPIILYDVEVNQALKGDAKGVVRVWYEGFNAETPDDAGNPGRLQQGERFIFFAGYNPNKDWYPVNASIGVIPIENERHLAALVATFEPLILQAERNARQPAPADPCEQRNQNAVVAVDPDQGAVGDEIWLTGGPFARAEVAVWWDDRDLLLDAAMVGDDCSIGTALTIPKADPGSHRILVEDALGNQATATIEVVEE